MVSEHRESVFVMFTIVSLMAIMVTRPSGSGG